MTQLMSSMILWWKAPNWNTF